MTKRLRFPITRRILLAIALFLNPEPEQEDLPIGQYL